MNEPAWIPTPPGPRETSAAAGAALMVGLGTAAVTFWLVRTFLAREPVDLRPKRLPLGQEEQGRLP